MAVDVILRQGAANPYDVILRRVLHIAGTTRDADGVPLPFCTVHLFRTSDDLEMDQGESDANGDFSFDIFDLVPYYVVATRFDETRWDVDTITFDTVAVTFDATQVDGVTGNNRRGT